MIEMFVTEKPEHSPQQEEDEDRQAADDHSSGHQRTPSYVFGPLEDALL